MKNLAKFAGGGILIALVGLGTLFGIRYLRARNDPAYQNERAAYEYVAQEKQLIQQMKDDPYGGETPEQTLGLFIDALKKGDTDLASKYFVVGEQEKWRRELEEGKEKGFLEQAVKDLEKTKVTKRDDAAFFSLVDENNLVISELIMQKNQLNKKWKITKL